MAGGRARPPLASAVVSQRPTALVTGATSGIGLEFARVLAARGHDLVLVARDLDRLAAVAAELDQRHGVTVETLSADLTVREEMLRVGQRLSDPARPVDLLVNNAGFGLNSFCVDGELTDELRQFDILCTAVLVLSHAAARAMRERGRGAIINVSSVSGFTVQVTYSSAKAWVTSFTEVLAGELRGTGVTATAVCPGYTRTEFHSRAGMDMAATPSWMWLTAGEVVTSALDAARRGRIVVVPSVPYRLLAGLLLALPRGLRWWIFWGRPGAHREGKRR